MERAAGNLAMESCADRQRGVHQARAHLTTYCGGPLQPIVGVVEREGYTCAVDITLFFPVIR